MNGPSSLAREQHLRDCFGRTYRIGPEPEDLTGRPRSWMLWAASAAMASVGILQYGYGAVAPSLVATRGWPFGHAFWLLAIWTVFQAGAGFGTTVLLGRGRVRPRTVLITGAALGVVGPLSLAHGEHIGIALAGFSILSGTGAGLVYAACTSTVAKWYPEQLAGKVSLATGAFAYGCVPFVLAFVLGGPAGNITIVLDAAAIAIAIAVGLAAWVLRDPPPDWWPSHVDPREWARDRRRHHGRAVRQFSAREALHTGALPLMYAIVFCASSVSLFNAIYVVIFATELGLVVPLVAVAAGVLIGANGAGRALAIRVSGVLGRRRTLSSLLLALTVGQLCFAGAASSGSTALVVLAALPAGIGGGAFYPLFSSLVREYFGDRNTTEIHAVVYSAKALGGVAGVGVTVLTVSAWGFPATFLGMGALALCSAILSRLLRRPGYLGTP